MKERFRPTLYTNTSTGDAPNDPARDPHETRRECQREVKVTSHRIHEVTKEGYDEVRPELRDARDAERVSRSLGRPSASQRTPQRAGKVPPAPLKVAAHFSQPQSPSRQPICRPSRQRKQQHAASCRCLAATRSLSASSNICQLPRGARQKL